MIEAAGPPELRASGEGPLPALVRAITYQQLAGRAAAAIHGRFVASFDREMAPESILALPDAPSRARLAELGVARISYGVIVHRRSLQALDEILAAVAAGSD